MNRMKLVNVMLIPALQLLPKICRKRCFVLEKETITCKIKIANGMIMTGIVRRPKAAAAA